MIRPTIRTLLLLTGGLGVSLLPTLLAPGWFPFWVAGLAGLALAAGLDALSAARLSDLAIEVDVPATQYIGDADPMTIRIRSRGRFPRTVLSVLPETSELFAAVPSADVPVVSESESRLDLPLRPLRRGTGTVDAVWLRWDGPLGLTRRTSRVPVERDVAVIPNVRAVKAAAIRHFSTRDATAGLKTERYLGDGTAFDSLREYLPGFDHRAIDWKASARHVKLIAREYRAERNHQIVVAVDTGRLMREPIEGVPKLDHAINAALLFGYVGLKTGDRVGLFTFDSRVRIDLPPRGGVGAFPVFRARSAEIGYSTEETNFTLSLMTLLGSLSRRTLVVLFTDFVDTVTVELMVENLARLAGRHLVLFVTLSDPDLSRVAEARPDGLEELTRSVIVGDILNDREVVFRRLRRLGVHCIDAPASAVSTELIDRYLEIKRRELV